MFDHRVSKFDSLSQYKRRLRRVQECTCKNNEDNCDCPVHGQDCECNGTETVACAYCRRKARRQPVPY